MNIEIKQGDSLEVLQKLPAGSVDCCITSPPYWQLRDYGVDGQLGLEETIEEFLDKLLAIFDEIQRVLKPEGTCWVNLGDTYMGHSTYSPSCKRGYTKDNNISVNKKHPDIRRKSLCMIPERFAIGMISRGWILRNQIIWRKPNCMPESVKDRFTNDFEKVFFFTKSENYYFEKQYEPQSESTFKKFKDGIIPISTKLKDQAEEIAPGRTKTGMRQGREWQAILPKGRSKRTVWDIDLKLDDVLTGIKMLWPEMKKYIFKNKDKATVWDIATRGVKEAHFATYPMELVEPMIKSGCPAGGTVLDPFFGSGQTGRAARKWGRNCIGIELNSEYIQLARKILGLDDLTLFG